MKSFGMFLRNSKELVNMTRQSTKEEAVTYFAIIKKMSVKQLKEIFTVKELER
tara:strand:- start:398 stop:556 length:159 start_codon:yes stop_codon:yes gene_type:complete